MTTQEKFDLIPNHYMAQFVHKDLSDSLVMFFTPNPVQLDLSKAKFKDCDDLSLEISIDNANIFLSKVNLDILIDIR
jgi:hypothetical protein